MSSILHSSESNEWYTPVEYPRLARKVMGSIDLDPASCALANTVIGAAAYFDTDADGLASPWWGNVWLNPPYGRTDGESNQGVWARRLIREYERGDVDQAVLLVNAVTDRGWFQPLWRFPVCFARRRIKYWRPEGAADSPTHGSAFVYLGPLVEDFVGHFRTIGTVVVDTRPFIEHPGQLGLLP